MMCILPGQYNIKRSFLLNAVHILTNLGNSSTSKTPIYSNLLIPTFMKSNLLNCVSYLIITPLCSCVSYLLLTTAVYCNIASTELCILHHLHLYIYVSFLIMSAPGIPIYLVVYLVD